MCYSGVMSNQFLGINARNLVIIILLSAVYFISAKLGLQLAFINASATAVWPPTGIAIASLLIFGFRIWPAIFLGAFLANLTTAGTAVTSLGIAFGNTLEGIVGAFLVNKFARGAFAFDRTRDIVFFTVCAGIIAPLIGATIGTLTLVLGGLSQAADSGPVWLTWWLGDATGALIIAPLILVWSTHYKITWSLQKMIEAVLLVFVILSVSWLIFGQDSRYPIDFIIFPVLLWVAFRFGVREVVTATFLMSAVAIWGTLHGKGPFASSSQNESLLLLQSFMAVVTITKVIVASVLAKGRELDHMKDDFVSMASHELRTPLAAIKGFMSMIIADRYGPLPENLKKPLTHIATSTDRLIVLVNGLLDLSRLEAGKLNPKITEFEINQLAVAVAENLMPIAGQKELNLKVKQSTPFKVKADPDYTRQILQNLIGNSLKFTQKGSVTVSINQSGNKVNIYVKDTGIGIAKSDQPKIFDKFHQVNSFKAGRPIGTGLGLYLSQDMAKTMGGSLKLDQSELGKGSAFVLSLPMIR
jgi:signal transduction histidine kinase